MKKLLTILLLIVGCEEPSQNGCLDSQAINYDPDATIDNNSCIYKHGCLDSQASLNMISKWDYPDADFQSISVSAIYGANTD